MTGIVFYIECKVSVPFDAGRGLMLAQALRDNQPGAWFQYPSMRVVD